MKCITIDGKTFEYEIYYYEGASGDGYYTSFYHGTENKSRKKYIFWGEKINKEVPKLMFKLWINIEDYRYTKDYIKGLLLEQIALLNRKEEIKRGEII